MLVWHWFVFAFILITLELLLGASFVFLWLGVSAIIVGLAVGVFIALTWEYAVILFVLLSCSSLVFWRFYNRYTAKSRQNTSSGLNARTEQYVNQVFDLVEPIRHGRGKIRIGDTTWIVTGPDAALGTRVRVVGTRGIVLDVMPIEEVH